METIKIKGRLCKPVLRKKDKNNISYYTLWVKTKEEELHCKTWNDSLFGVIEEIQIDEEIEVLGSYQKFINKYDNKEKEYLIIQNIVKEKDSFRLNQNPFNPPPDEEASQSADYPLINIKKRFSKISENIYEISWLFNSFEQSYKIPRQKLCFLFKKEIKKLAGGQEDLRDILFKFSLWDSTLLSTWFLIIHQKTVERDEFFHARSLISLAKPLVSKFTGHSNCDYIIKYYDNIGIKKNELEKTIGKKPEFLNRYEAAILYAIAQKIAKKHITKELFLSIS